MADALSILTSIAIVLLAGIIVSLVSKRFKLPKTLLLIILGMILKTIKYNGTSIFTFSPTFLISVSVLALVMITFDGSSRLTLKEVEKFSSHSARIVGWFIITNILLLGTFTAVIFFPNFSFESIIFSLMFAIVMAGTGPGTVFSLMKDKINKTVDVLEIESIINTPIIVLMPFLLLDLLTNGNNQIVNSFLDQIIPFLTQIIVGVGAGVVVGIIIFKAMKNAYHHQLSPLAIITAALLSYILAENLGGNGILSVAVMGLFFGNIYVKKKIFLQEFSSIFSNSLEILVFVLIGFLITLNFSIAFFLKSIVLFIIMIIARWFAIIIALRNTTFNLKEKLFMTLNISKGIAVAAVIFSLSIKQITGLKIIIDLILVFIFYSIIQSSIVEKYSKKFIHVESKPE